MAQQQTIGKHETNIFTDNDGFLCVKYHETIVFKMKDNKTFLFSGGWHTQTTKTRINQALNTFGFRVKLIQIDGEWFIKDYTKLIINDTFPFFEGIKIVK